MFHQSIVSGEESRRPWTFSVSLLAQALLVALAVLVPLLAKPMLPALNAAMVSLQLPKPPNAAPPPVEQGAAVRVRVFDDVLQQPRRMPTRAAPLVDGPAPTFEVTGVVGAGSFPADTLITAFAEDIRVAPPPPKPAVEPAAPSQPILVSSTVQAARIVRRVMPNYPPLARSARVSGVVRLQAIIAADGTIAELTVVSGHPLLIAAAVDAVKQWRYRPTVLGGKSVPVDTQIEVNFTLRR